MSNKKKLSLLTRQDIFEIAYISLILSAVIDYVSNRRGECASPNELQYRADWSCDIHGSGAWLFILYLAMSMRGAMLYSGFVQ